MKLLTLCILREKSQVLLGMKKRGFGAGRWNGFGGKVEKGETVEEAAKREVFEEVGIEVKQLEKVGILEFEFKKIFRQGSGQALRPSSGQALRPSSGQALRPSSGQAGELLEVHIFRCENFSGEPTESDEMAPKWFDVGEIPYKKMWPDDIYWLPMFLEGKKFKGRFLFGPGDVVIEYKLKEVKELL